MKTLMIAIMATFFTLSFTACGDKEEDTGSDCECPESETEQSDSGDQPEDLDTGEEEGAE